MQDVCHMTSVVALAPPSQLSNIILGSLRHCNTIATLKANAPLNTVRSADYRREKK